MKVLVLSARDWEMADDDGEIRRGVKFSYVDPLEEATGSGAEGVPPMAISGPATLKPKVKEVPGVYELEFRQRPGKNNRPVLTLVDATFVKGVNIAEIVNRSTSPTGRKS